MSDIEPTDATLEVADPLVEDHLYAGQLQSMRWLIFIFQQLLKIFYETNHNHDGRPCHSNKEERYDYLRD